MTQPSFLARKTFAVANYFWIAMGFALIVAMVPVAARRALQSNTNKAEDWLPDSYSESLDLRWFRRHFISEGFVLVTWDGCTLGNSEKLRLLERKLGERIDASIQPVAVDGLRPPVTQHREKWFRKIISGPGMIDELTRPPLSLSYNEALRRLEGALIGPPQPASQGGQPDDDTRVTCVVIYLSAEGYENNRAMRKVVSYVQDVAVNECGIPEPQLHMGGPIVDNVAIDRAGEGSLATLALLSGLVGLGIAYGCLRNLKLTAVVVAVGGISAAVGVAIVYYFGVFETLIMGRDTPFYGTMDAILMSMPALVYVLGVSGAIHFVNYYRESRVAGGVSGAVERAVRAAWVPCGMVALTAAIGFGSLVTSDIVPIRKFGGFSAAGIMATMGVLFTVLPIYLHCFPPSSIGRRGWNEMSIEDERLPAWAAGFYRWLARNHAVVTCVMLGLMALAGVGLFRLESSVRLLKLLDDKADLVQDYTWVENHMGNLVPMEVLLTIPPEKFRSGDELAEDGKQYRMTMLERLSLLRKIVARIEALDEVSRTLSAATLAPDKSQRSAGVGAQAENYATNKNLEEHRNSFRDYLQMQQLADGEVAPTSCELWRISARVTALRDIDYGLFTDQLRRQVEPVLAAYRRRDKLIAELSGQGHSLADSSLCVIYEGKSTDDEPDAGSNEGLLLELLKESAGVPERIGDLPNPLSFNLEVLEGISPEIRRKTIELLRSCDAVVVVSETARPAANNLAAEGVKVVDLTHSPPPNGSLAAQIAATAGQRPIGAVYTGIIPLVFKTQRQLLFSLRSSLFSSGFLIVVVMAIVFRSVMAGAISMLPNLFPVLLVFGTLGLLGVKMDIGIVMTASVALGVAVDSTVHLVTWFYHCQAQEPDRRKATLKAYEHCAPATLQGALISGLGLAVFAFSGFTPTRQFGYLMITIQSAALLGDLVLLPALFCGPLGRFFERHRHVPGSNLAEPQRDPIQAAGTEGTMVASTAATAKAQGVPVRPLKSTGTAVPAAKTNNGDTVDEPVDVEVPHPHAPRRGDTEPLASPSNTALRDKLRSFRRPK
jgi:predicted RND superfamily exporter protein